MTNKIIQYSNYIQSAEEDETLLVPEYAWAATLENPNQHGVYLGEAEFNKLQSKLCSNLDLSKCSREEAKQHLEERASNLGIIEYFILRAVIAWLIESILDTLFGNSE